MNQTAGTQYGISVFSGDAIEVTYRDSRIESVTEFDADARELPYIAPGFFDMQVNGYRGSDYSLEDFNEEHLRSIVDSLAEAGTTQHVPTIVSRPQAQVVRNIRTIVEARRNDPVVAAAIPGLHVEGPFISGEDGPRGVHDPVYVRDPQLKDFEEWQDAAEGLIRYVTVAPERDGAIEFIRELTRRGVVVGIGHTGASPDQIRSAVYAGAAISTHLGNGSYTTLPRLRNYIWEQLASDQLYAGMISDGYHLPASVVRVFARAKGLDRLILVSDAALLGGCETGIHKWGNIDVEVFPDGHLGIPGTSILAGAAHLLDWDIVRFMESTGNSLGAAVRLCTENPARLLGLQNDYGTLVPGAIANLCLFHYVPRNERLAIDTVVRAGQRVFEVSRV